MAEKRSTVCSLDECGVDTGRGIEISRPEKVSLGRGGKLVDKRKETSGYRGNKYVRRMEKGWIRVGSG